MGTTSCGCKRKAFEVIVMFPLPSSQRRIGPVSKREREISFSLDPRFKGKTQSGNCTPWTRLWSW